MIGIQPLPGCFDIDLFLRPGVPRQVQADIQIVPDDRRLGRTLGLLGQPGDLLQQLFLCVLGKLQGLDLLPVFVQLVVLVLLTQLGADDLELLPELVILLALVDALLGALIELALDAQDLQLLRQQPVGQLQPLDRVQLLEDLHFLLIAKRRVLA